MKKTFLAFILLASLVSCKKDNLDEPENPDTEVSVAAYVTDPVNFPPGASNIKPNALQLNYGTIKVTKSMNLLMTNVTPGIMSNYSFHIYLKVAGKYIHLPASSSTGVAYTYSLKAAYPYCSVTITRPQGTGEIFDDVIVVAANASYLSTFSPAINFSDYASVKTKLGL